MDAIREKHKTLISGLTKLYDTLVAMHYISASDVCRPPHTSPAIDVARLQGLGFDAEVIDLVQLLPGLRHEVTWGYQTQGTQLVPRSKAVNYFAPPSEGAYLDLMDDVRNGDFAKWDEAKKLDPWLLRLTDGGDYGVHLIYDTRNRESNQPDFVCFSFCYLHIIYIDARRVEQLTKRVQFRDNNRVDIHWKQVLARNSQPALRHGLVGNTAKTTKPRVDSLLLSQR